MTIRHFFFDFQTNLVQRCRLEHKHDLFSVCLHFQRSRLRLLIRLTRNRVDEMNRLQNFVYLIYT